MPNGSARDRDARRPERIRLGSAALCWPGGRPPGFAPQEAVVPKSRVRKRTVYTPPPPKSARRKVSAPWVGPTIVACLVLGLAWIAIYYITSGSFPGMSALGSWNLVVGFALIIAGVALSTTWR
jgi:Cell division protein CrgA